MQAASVKRLTNLDMIRVFAALSVAMFHYTVQYPEFSGQENLFPFIWYSGTIHLFFIISGFVILLSCSRTTPLNFIKKRFIAIYPPLLICCTITAIILLFSTRIISDVSLINYFYNITLISNFTYKPLIEGAYWTLSYEIGFYIFMALSFKLFFQRILWVLPLYLMAGSFLYYLFSAYIPNPLHLFMMMHNYSHLFAYGMICYLWHQNGFKTYYLAFLPSIFGLHYLHHGLDSAYIVLFCAIIFPALIFFPFPETRLKIFLCRLGGYSYIFYLLHQMIGFVIIAELSHWGLYPMVILLSTFILIGAISFVIKHIALKAQNYLKEFLI